MVSGTAVQKSGSDPVIGRPDETKTKVRWPGRIDILLTILSHWRMTSRATSWAVIPMKGPGPGVSFMSASRIFARSVVKSTSNWPDDVNSATRSSGCIASRYFTAALRE